MGQIFDPGRIFDLLSHDIQRIFSQIEIHILIFCKLINIKEHLKKTWNFFGLPIPPPTLCFAKISQPKLFEKMCAIFCNFSQI